MVAAVQALATEWSGRDFGEVTGDTAAQAAVCAAPILAACGALAEAATSWLQEQLSPWERSALDEAMRRSSAPFSVSGSANSDSPKHLYDSFLQVYAQARRKQHGVYFTPPPIADYIIRQIDGALLADGVALHSALRAPHSAFLLDPACGTGVFLLAALDLLHAQLGDDWNAAAGELLPRLIGIEILPAAAFLAKLNVALKLAETGYDFREAGEIQIHCGDALNHDFLLRIAHCKLPNCNSDIPTSSLSFPIILGNPPFSSLSNNSNPWIARLVRGDDRVRGYVRAGEQRLGERKTWLHDDYVKFIRLAQWHVEQAGSGIVALVTNRGYLENATFRLLRQELLRVFPQIRILDLHGSRKAGEVAPGGERDESVFGLDQGVAIGVFGRPRTPVGNSFAYSELWGAKEAKLAALASGRHEPPTGEELRVTLHTCSPIAPAFDFTAPRQPANDPEYQAAWSLADAMPLNATAPVTARDHFVVAFTADELRRRIADFRDLSIADDEIRRRYFQRTRSVRYAVGDSRGWKLPAARRVVAADADWQAKIVRCLYRPFDWRFVFWHPAMIDWPRSEVARHLLTSPPEHSPLCLIARRQQPPQQPCTYFWIADGLSLDGVIRSDNRGSESLFPLYLCEAGGRRANFDPAFAAQIAAAAGLNWLPQGEGDWRETFGPLDLLAYIYGLFHSPAYRSRYRTALQTAFPRVLPPVNREQFRRLSRLGRELIDLHLLRGTAANLSGDACAVSSAAASFRAGSYVALRKWLQPKHRSATHPEYGRIVAAIKRTLEVVEEIDGGCGAACQAY